MLVAQVDPLGQPPFGEAPEVEVVAEPPSEQILGVEPVLDHRRRRPLGRDGDVVVQVPPDVVAEVLVSAVRFPTTGDLEGFVVDQRDAAGAIGAVCTAEIRHEDAAGAAVHRMRRE
jgi:hypothetical protein